MQQIGLFVPLGFEKCSISVLRSFAAANSIPGGPALPLRCDNDNAAQSNPPEAA